tara:strand:+ start:16513 stop:18150 length:1638 start_codon:yes stop_codon:yes gene_type:complete
MATFYTYVTEKYGPLPHQHMLVGRPTLASGANGATDRWGYLYVPGGGWGLRDQVAITRDWGPRSSLMQGVFDHDDGAGEPFEAATVFVLNVASESQNSLATAPTAGDAEYALDPTSGFFPDVSSPAAGAPYSVNDVVYGASQAYISLQDSNNEPLGTATHWATYEANACLAGRRPGGEGSPGSCAQSAKDVQRAIAYIRQRSSEYNISSDKVLLEGSSAGAQAAGCAAYSDPLNYGHDSHLTAVAPDTAYTDCRPNGLILSIAACKLDEFGTINRSSVQGQFLSFMESLFGQQGFVNWNGWDAVSDSRKRAVDPANNVLRSGYFVPTYFLYNSFIDCGMSNIWTREEQANSVTAAMYSTWTDASGDYAEGELVKNIAGDKFYKCVQAHTPGNGLGGTVAEPGTTADTDYWAYTPAYAASSSDGSWTDMIHHSQNGREFMRILGSSRASGGFALDMSSAANSDVRLMVKDFSVGAFSESRGVDGQYNIYYGPPTNQQYRLDDSDKSINREKVVNTSGGATNPDKQKIVSDEVIAFFTSNRRNKYMG